MSDLGEALGRALREARVAAGLTLRDLRDRSDGHLKPSAVGGYERGERAISVERLCVLARACGAAPDQVLARALEIMKPKDRVHVVIDLTRLDLVEEPDRERIREFVEGVRARRGDTAEVITLRAGDVETLAAASGVRPSDLLARLEPARAHPLA
jgi:transcriptional regulator with XRE-family HTH domain